MLLWGNTIQFNLFFFTKEVIRENKHLKLLFASFQDCNLLLCQLRKMETIVQKGLLFVSNKHLT